MISKSDLQEAIKECEGTREPNANTCIKLAAFYTILNNLYPDEAKQGVEPEPVRYSYAVEEPTLYESDTEFFRLIENKSTDEILALFDEVMSTLQVVNPKLYEAVLRKLNNM